jgi:hypothetical protein
VPTSRLEQALIDLAHARRRWGYVFLGLGSLQIVMAMWLALRSGDFRMGQNEVAALLLGLFWILESVPRLLRSPSEGFQHGVQLSAALIAGVGAVLLLWGTMAEVLAR